MLRIYRIRIHSTGVISGADADLMLYRKQREEEQRKEAELKMLQHWRINNPAARQVTCSFLFTLAHLDQNYKKWTRMCE
jgi:hypothetical protein